MCYWLIPQLGKAMQLFDTSISTAVQLVKTSVYVQRTVFKGGVSGLDEYKMPSSP